MSLTPGQIREKAQLAFTAAPQLIDHACREMAGAKGVAFMDSLIEMATTCTVLPLRLAAARELREWLPWLPYMKALAARVGTLEADRLSNTEPPDDPGMLPGDDGAARTARFRRIAGGPDVDIPDPP